MEITLVIPMFVVSLVSSIVTELLKAFPKLAKTDERKRIVAFIVALIISVIYVLSENPSNRLTFICGVFGATFLIYKSIVQPVEEVGKSVIKKLKKHHQN